jgi:membrane protease subunit HflC
MKRKIIWVIIPAVVLIYFLGTMLFCVDERSTAVLLRFGKPVRTITAAGLNLKMPDPVETAIFLDKRMMLLDPAAFEYLTQDKQNIVADIYLCWRIVDPITFIQALRTKEIAESRLEDIIRSTTGAVIGAYPLASFVSSDEAGSQLDTIMSLVTQRCDKQIRSQYGIAVTDVKMKRFNFPEDNLPSVYARMWAERERIARKYRAEGHKAAAEIKAEADKEARVILSEAYKEGEIIKGRGDAQAMKIYAQAYRKNPDFYEFMRTLEAYRALIDSNTTIILSSSSPLLKLLEKGPVGNTEEE